MPLTMSYGQIRRSLSDRFKVIAAASMFLAVPLPAYAGVALPGDVFYSADVFQRYKYDPFVNDYVQWEDATIEDTSLLYSASHDTSDVLGTTHISTGIEAEAGLLEFNLNSEMTLAAQFGVYHETYNNLELRIYLHGPTGTPYDITMTTTGILQASREGGLPGTIQPVNGNAIAKFNSDQSFSNGGTFELPLDHYEIFSGVTTTQIVVDGETYSLAKDRIFTTFGQITQAFCILGCMQAPADFHALIDAHLTVRVYPGGATGVGDVAASAMSIPLLLGVTPNPARGAAEVTFIAPAGERTQVNVFDVNGRRVAQLFEALATGAWQSVRWDAGVPPGIYFLRAETGGNSKTEKITLLR